MKDETSSGLRPRLLGLAYRMLGELDGAEDVVQEAFLRWHQQDQTRIESPEAWLVTVASRLALDRLRRATADRARYVGPWLPEPVVTGDTLAPPPDHRTELASDLSVALLLLLETLAPEERAAFLLREVFDTSYDVVARILERSPASVRQMVHRARVRVREGKARTPSAASQHQLLNGFLAALHTDDEQTLLALLSPEVTLTSDGGGRARAARRPVLGADRVARFLRGVHRKAPLTQTRLPTTLNGHPSWLTFEATKLVTATMLQPEDDGRVGAVYIIRNPQKLQRLRANAEIV